MIAGGDANCRSTNYATDVTTFQGYGTTTHATLSSPNAELDALWEHQLMKEQYRAHFQMSSNGYQYNTAGSYTYFSAFGRDGYGGALALAQVAGGAALTRDEYLLFISRQYANKSQSHEIIDSFQTTGFRQDAGNNGAPGDQEMFEILKLYQYYIGSQDATFLTAHIADVNAIAAYLKDWYDNQPSGKSSDGLFCGHGQSTYLDSGGNLLTGTPTYLVDPVMNSILIHALRAVIELNTVAGNTATAATYTTWRNTLVAAMPLLWSSVNNWLAFNKNQAGTETIANPHLMKLDALVFDALQDTAKQQAMMAKIAGPASKYWNGSTGICGFTMFPSVDPRYSGLGIGWYGPPWHIGDYKAFGAIFRYGAPEQAQWAWERLKQHTQRVMHVNQYAPGEYYSSVGQFEFSAGSMTQMITRDLFGLDPHASYFTCTPNIYKLNDTAGWNLSNYRMGGSTWTVTYSGKGAVQTVKVDGVTQTGNIAYPTAGSHTLAITATGRTVV